MWCGKDWFKKLWKQVDLDSVRYGFIKNKSNGLIFAVVDSILDYNFDITNISIALVVNNCPVIGIGRAAFSSSIEIKTVDLPQSIMFIDELAFSGCRKLCEINVPPMLKEIHWAAFMDCYSLEKMDISSDVKIEEGAFTNCPLEDQYKEKYISRHDMHK